MQKATVHSSSLYTISNKFQAVTISLSIMSIIWLCLYFVEIYPPASNQWMGELHVVTNKSSKLLIANIEGGHSEMY